MVKYARFNLKNAIRDEGHKMMTETLVIVAKCIAAILIGILAGNGAVYFFNKIPGKWLCDYGQEKSEAKRS